MTSPVCSDQFQANIDQQDLLPVYSTRPGEDEETVAYTPRNLSVIPHGTFTKDWPQVTLTLNDQEDGTTIPSYGRQSQIIGELGLKNTRRIVGVTAKFMGRLDVDTADSGSVRLDFISNTQVLWKREDNKQYCPSILPVFFQIPITYEGDGNQWHLPPSFELAFSDMIVKIEYTLNVSVTETRLWEQWQRTQTFGTVIQYRPRSRPTRPMVMFDTVLDSVNSAPAEWIQIIDRMDVRPKFRDEMKPIECQVFIPSIQTFGLSDTIPFHLQLVSSVVSLRALLPPSSPLLLPEGQTRTSVTNCGKDMVNTEMRTTIQAVISRQIVIEVNGGRKLRTYIVGQGRLWPVPPSIQEQTDSASTHSLRKTETLPCDNETVYLDWQGEARCPQITLGGFLSGCVSVKVRNSIKIQSLQGLTCIPFLSFGPEFPNV